MKQLLFLLVLGTVTATTAIAHSGDKNDNNGEKTDKGAKAKTTTSTNRLEEFIWTLPQSSKVEKVDDAEMQKAMVDLYKWYLQNETRINNSSSIKGDNIDAPVAPFKVDPKVLQQYLKFIKKNFPGLNEEDLTDKRITTSAVKRKNAPVSTCDDLDAPMSLTASK